MRATLEKWIPIMLAAQDPDGYLQTAYTLADRAKWPARWNPANRGDHEGYVAGYFIESAINHYTLTGGKDLRLYNAAKKLADCWVANIGPGKKVWFDGHQEMEQALVRFGRFVNDVEGGGRGDAYIALARFLLESRDGGGSIRPEPPAAAAAIRGRWATPCARCISTRAWRTSRRRRTTATTRARCVSLARQPREPQVLRHRRHRQRRHARRASATTMCCATTATASPARAAASCSSSTS